MRDAHSNSGRLSFGTSYDNGRQVPPGPCESGATEEPGALLWPPRLRYPDSEEDGKPEAGDANDGTRGRQNGHEVPAPTAGDSALGFERYEPRGAARGRVVDCGYGTF